jgi:hypothetical protein
MATGRPVGRPKGQFRTPELARKICELIAEGFTLAQVARTVGYAGPSGIAEWRRQDPEFDEMYARAKQDQMDHLAEELLEIADDGTNDWVEREIGAGKVVKVPDLDHINRSRLRVDTRKWLMAKMAPKKYGDRLIVDAKIDYRTADQLSDDELARIAAGGGGDAVEAPELPNEPSGMVH